MEEQLQILLSHEEYHGDVLLAELVRLQRIVQDITQIVPYDEPHRPRSFGMPFLMHLKSLDRSLQDYENSLPEILKKHGMFIFWYNFQSVEVVLTSRLSLNALTYRTHISVRSWSI